MGCARSYLCTALLLLGACSSFESEAARWTTEYGHLSINGPDGWSSGQYKDGPFVVSDKDCIGVVYGAVPSTGDARRDMKKFVGEVRADESTLRVAQLANGWTRTEISVQTGGAKYGMPPGTLLFVNFTKGVVSQGINFQWERQGCSGTVREVISGIYLNDMRYQPRTFPSPPSWEAKLEELREAQAYNRRLSDRNAQSLQSTIDTIKPNNASRAAEIKRDIERERVRQNR